MIEKWNALKSLFSFSVQRLLNTNSTNVEFTGSALTIDLYYKNFNLERLYNLCYLILTAPVTARRFLGKYPYKLRAMTHCREHFEIQLSAMRKTFQLSYTLFQKEILQPRIEVCSEWNFIEHTCMQVSSNPQHHDRKSCLLEVPFLAV